MKTAIAIVITVALLTAASFGLRAADPKPKYSIEDVMKTLHKGKENLAKKVSDGQGTKEDFAKLIEYYTALPLNKPAKGDAASWKEKCSALIKSAEALKAGTSGALESYKKAVNCKGCHSVHRPD